LRTSEELRRKGRMAVWHVFFLAKNEESCLAKQAIISTSMNIPWDV
jgi:hypothetical protein